jgi:hypothetical protein
MKRNGLSTDCAGPRVITADQGRREGTRLDVVVTHRMRPVGLADGDVAEAKRLGVGEEYRSRPSKGTAAAFPTAGNEVLTAIAQAALCTGFGVGQVVERATLGACDPAARTEVGPGVCGRGQSLEEDHLSAAPTWRPVLRAGEGPRCGTCLTVINEGPMPCRAIEEVLQAHSTLEVYLRSASGHGEAAGVVHAGFRVVLADRPLGSAAVPDLPLAEGARALEATFQAVRANRLAARRRGFREGSYHDPRTASAMRRVIRANSGFGNGTRPGNVDERTVIAMAGEYVFPTQELSAQLLQVRVPDSLAAPLIGTCRAVPRTKRALGALAGHRQTDRDIPSALIACRLALRAEQCLRNLTFNLLPLPAHVAAATARLPVQAAQSHVLPYGLKGCRKHAPLVVGVTAGRQLLFAVGLAVDVTSLEVITTEILVAGCTSLEIHGLSVDVPGLANAKEQTRFRAGPGGKGRDVAEIAVNVVDDLERLLRVGPALYEDGKLDSLLNEPTFDGHDPKSRE